MVVEVVLDTSAAELVDSCTNYQRMMVAHTDYYRSAVVDNSLTELIHKKAVAPLKNYYTYRLDLFL